MAFIRPRARILERTITAGNGPYALAGAVDNSYNTFASFMAVGDKTYVAVKEPGVAFWTGIATYSAANEITLTEVEESKGTFGAGTKEVMAGPLASTATFREDISGAIVTGGTSTAYTVASYRRYDTLARLNGNIIAFTPHATNSDTLTLNVDGLGAKPLRSAPGAEIFPATLIAGTPYLALYNHTDQVFYLHGFFANPFNIPLGSGIDYWGPATPNSAFVFPVGQAISRTAFAPLFALFGTKFGAGNGMTTFNLPNKVGKVSAGADNMAGSPAGILNATGGMNGTDVGSTGGGQTHQLTRPQIPTGITSDGPNLITVTSLLQLLDGAILGSQPLGGGAQPSVFPGAIRTQTSQGNNSIAVATNNTGGGAHPNVQPTITCNYILRVL